MDNQHVATILYTDGVWREVWEDSSGRQHVINADGDRVYGVWYIPEEVEPDVVIQASSRGV